MVFYRFWGYCITFVKFSPVLRLDWRDTSDLCAADSLVPVFVSKLIMYARNKTGTSKVGATSKAQKTQFLKLKGDTLEAIKNFPKKTKNEKFETVS